ncbi:hypothetical protein [Nocardioides sp. AX2bis]|uniref:hypothetical protein n=1 Tax=Nocardioides sp. AX2bis TaxID=2653157 RepID=UPI0012F30911|nr:hypothetical protein [Nocardioides sp. AX2bis]VXB36227.1 conserved hypothetical protein [Nocardioides sp. AX2bis]
MTQQWTLPAWAVLLPAAVGLVLLVVVLLVAARVGRTERRLVATGAEVDALRDVLAVLEQQQRAPTTSAATSAATSPAAAPTAVSDYVITRVGDEPEDDDTTAVEPARVVAAPLFADLVLRESVVQAASLAAGVRRALAPEVRHRVRLEMKRDVKRARKQRRADLRAARRDWEARRRAEVDLDDPALDEGSAA